jgi:hypothetical protein
MMHEQIAKSNTGTTIAAMLQRWNDGDRLDDVVDLALQLLTDRPDAPRLISDRGMKRLHNVFLHHGRSYKALVATVAAAITNEIESNGMTLALSEQEAA